MMDVPWLSHLIIFITVSSFRAQTSSQCPANQFLHPDGICCEFCPIGLFMYKPCQVPGSRALCFHCKMGTSYMDKVNNMTMCKQCSVCDPESEVEERECDIEYNRLCVCREGFQRKGTKCGKDESTRDEPVSADIGMYKLLFWMLLFGVLYVILFLLWRRKKKHFKSTLLFRQ